jgi:hypothetical protein
MRLCGCCFPEDGQKELLQDEEKSMEMKTNQPTPLPPTPIPQTPALPTQTPSPPPVPQELPNSNINPQPQDAQPAPVETNPVQAPDAILRPSGAPVAASEPEKSKREPEVNESKALEAPKAQHQKKPKAKTSDAAAWTAFPDLEAKITNRNSGNQPSVVVTPPNQAAQPQAPSKSSNTHVPVHKGSNAAKTSDPLNSTGDLEISRSESASTIGSRDEAWEGNDKSNKCRVCSAEFGLFNRKHHCRKW